MRKRKMKFYIWEGVYKSFKEVPAKGAGFESDTWIKKSLKNFEKLKKNQDTRDDKALMLSLLTGVLSGKNKLVTILDFGGGIGLTYFSIIKKLATPHILKYCVVDNKKVCETGKNIFKNNKNVSFHEKLPFNLPHLDIVHIGSTLQYIEDWESLLSKLADYKPKYILFTSLPVGNIPTYVTAQNYYGNKIPYRFFNITKFIGVLNKLNYKLLFKMPFFGYFLGKEQKFPQDNFPKKLRIGQPLNLLFITRYAKN